MAPVGPPPTGPPGTGIRLRQIHQNWNPTVTPLQARPGTTVLDGMQALTEEKYYRYLDLFRTLLRLTVSVYMHADSLYAASA